MTKPNTATSDVASLQLRANLVAKIMSAPPLLQQSTIEEMKEMAASHRPCEAIAPTLITLRAEYLSGRKAIERRIDRHLALVTALLAVLDTQDGDADLEDGNDEEQLNEDGGDVQDEPHDEEPDREYSLGWGIPTADIGQGAGFMAQGLQVIEGDREADYFAVDGQGYANARSSDDEPDKRRAPKRPQRHAGARS